MSIIRARWAAIGAAVAVTIGAGGGLGLAQATQSSGERPVFVSIVPCRVADTRPGQGVGGRTSPIGPSEALAVNTRPAEGPCAGQVPVGATGVGLNITAVQATASTFLTVYPGGADNPGTSTLNPEPSAARTVNGATTGIDAAGIFNVFNNAGSVHAIIDINGYYVDHDHDDRYYTEAEVDAAISGAVEVVTSADQSVVSADPDQRLSSATITTTQAGRWHATMALDGAIFCGAGGSASTAYYLMLDDEMIPSSVLKTSSGERVTATLTGVTEAPIPPGTYTLRVAGECRGASSSGASWRQHASASVLVLPS